MVGVAAMREDWGDRDTSCAPSVSSKARKDSTEEDEEVCERGDDGEWPGAGAIGREWSRNEHNNLASKF